MTQEGSVKVVVGFALEFWVGRKEHRERIMLDLIGKCPVPGCGGKLHIVVHVGNIEDGRYFVKNREALWQDEEFPLPRSAACTNCEGGIEAPEKLAAILSKVTEEFVRDFRELRKSSRAPWN